MNLRQKLQKIYNETLQQKHQQKPIEKQKSISVKQREKESKEWVEKILTPYLLKHANEGRIKIRQNILSIQNMRDPMYLIAIEKTGVTIVTFGRNYIGLSWD